jgi:3-oxoacyl-[acyl-carrier-protein] synthase III
MRYNNVYIDSFGYELPPVVVTTAELEERLAPMYEALHVSKGQLEHITGIQERRWWSPGYPVSRGAIAAGRKAFERSNVRPEEIEALIFGSVCREQYEPATACRVAAGLGVGGRATVYDISNACLGIVNGVVDLANRIELGQIRAGMVVGCETAREINEVMIEQMLESNGMEMFIKSLATLTGGSGACAVIVTDGSFGEEKRRRLLGGAVRSAPEFHDLCIWGIRPSAEQVAENATEGRPQMLYTPFTCTDSAAVLENGVVLGKQTWLDFLEETGWTTETIDKTILHQVGGGHHDAVFKALGVDRAKDFATYPFLGNIGTVSLPITAAIAEDRGFLAPGNHVALCGIGSGLNCLLLGVEW